MEYVKKSDDVCKTEIKHLEKQMIYFHINSLIVWIRFLLGN